MAAGLAISGVFELAPLRDSPHVNDKVKLTEVEIEALSPMRLPGVNKPLSIAFGTGELPAMIGASRDFHAYRAQSLSFLHNLSSGARLSSAMVRQRHLRCAAE